MGRQDVQQRVSRGELPGGVPQSKRKVAAKTGDYTCVDSDSGTVFTTEGSSADVDFTLPTTAEGAGWHAWFMNASDNEMGVISPSSGDDIIGFNDVAADSVRYTDATEQIGGGFYVVGTGTKWLVFVACHGLGATAQIVTTT
jgi:hypothetical protein